MCGITGWVSYGADLRGFRNIVERMTHTMVSRGPDGYGVWIREHVALGHRRLAVIDPIGGRQPMIAETSGGAVAISYSGEIYNFTELREDLIGRGHVFKTQCDTEVALNGYIEWGESVAEYLNGMFAFAIWDERDAKLVLVRDRMGIKPLYYYTTGDGLLFGSEPKAIFANPLASKAVDADGLREMLASTKAPGCSPWKNVAEVEPGTTVTVTPAGTRTHTYWRLKALEHHDDRLATVNRIRELMADVVHRQLVADVPRCVLLSGGLDSSAITGLAALHLAEQGEELRTFSVDFDGYEANFRPTSVRLSPDAPYVRDMVNHVGSRHRNVMLDSSMVADLEVRRATIQARDAPNGWGDLDTSLYLLFKSIRTTSTVALSGESADEVFGGYPWFSEDLVQNSKTFPWMAMSKSRMTDPLAWLHPDLRNSLDIPTYIADQYSSAATSVDHLDDADELEQNMRTACYLHLTRFVRTLLDRKDRMSMATSLEVRVPFCDHRLVEYVYNTPWRLKRFDGREKSLLRHATKHVVPESISNRVKSGYPLTQDSAYVKILQQQARDIVAEPGALVFDLVDHSWLSKATSADGDIPSGVKAGINSVLDLYHWLEIYKPKLVLP
ncbi:asparagine synthase (glutamine-hydrolyzing) [Phytoactinopolyspora mesophila]|uniref:asparagine synthase (glutamine-hydrolyzing) n=1 Tax=Phytoactinopolyspora mesophila TaxID=2650750 RepID=A0A7K3MCW7_9ACTN|nr:asparagine synthase (glutamine-hydrolyzing) [Phytoactinopolyspora mesophila]